MVLYQKKSRLTGKKKRNNYKILGIDIGMVLEISIRITSDVIKYAYNRIEEVMKMDRITEHPILGETPEGRVVNFTYDGQPLQGIEGEPIAAALRVAGVMVHRYTKKRHEPRGVFCAIGRCTDCVMIVNGKPNIRTCITPLEEGMEIKTQYGTSDKKEEE